MSIKVRQNGKYLIEMLIYYSGIHFIAWIFVLQANKNPEYYMAQVYFIYGNSIQCQCQSSNFDFEILTKEKVG